jgi:hypothetical protein
MKKNGWLKMKNKAVHSSHMSGSNGAEENVDRDWVDEDDATVGEGGEGLGQKTKEAAMSNFNQIPKLAISFLMVDARARRRNRG